MLDWLIGMGAVGYAFYKYNNKNSSAKPASKPKSKTNTHKAAYSTHSSASDYYNQYKQNASKKTYDAYGYDSEGYDKEGYDRRGFNKSGIHKITGDQYDLLGFNKFGYDKDGYDKRGFDNRGYHKITKDRYDLLGYDKDGYDKEGYDQKGFNSQGLHKITGTKYDFAGFDKDGFNQEGWQMFSGFHKTGTHIYTKDIYNHLGFDKYGFNKEGYNIRGFDKFGVHKDTGHKYDEYGMDIERYDVDGYDILGFNRYGERRVEIGEMLSNPVSYIYSPEGYNKLGYDVDGYNMLGFDKYGIHRDTRSFYDLEGYNGYRRNKEGFTKEGFDYFCMHKVTKTPYDPEGYDCGGVHKDTGNIRGIRSTEEVFNEKSDIYKTKLIEMFENKKVLLDTNIFMLEKFDWFFEFLLQNRIPVVILSDVYDELVKLKTSSNIEKSKRAKLGIRRVHLLQEHNILKIVNLDIAADMRAYADPNIINLFKSGRLKDTLLITNDYDVKIRAKNFVNSQNDVYFGDDVLGVIENYGKYTGSLKIEEMSVNNDEIVEEEFVKQSQNITQNSAPLEKIVSWASQKGLPFQYVPANPLLNTPEHYWGVPRSAEDLKQMEYLALYGLNLSEIPDEIGELKNLRGLYLQTNSLSFIPESICELYNLNELNLLENPLVRLPENIGKLSNLNVLSFDAAYMNDVPLSITQLSPQLVTITNSAKILNIPYVNNWLVNLQNRGVMLQIM